MTVTLSSKGQLVIPKAIRKALALKPGTRFEVKLDGHQIVLEPQQKQADFEALLNSLCGSLAGTDALEQLEQEHKWEIERDEKRGF